MGAFNPDAGCTIPTNLVAFWKLEEASGTRFDEIGSNDLTDNNTVTQATGIVGNAGQFVAANSEYLSLPDNADLSTGDIDFTFSFWIFLNTLPSVSGLDFTPLTKDSVNGAGTREYVTLIDQATDKLGWTIFDSGGITAGNVVTVSALTTGTWINVICSHEASTSEISLTINNGTPVTATATGNPSDTSADFGIGARLRASGASEFFNGRIDEVGFWKKVLTAQERSDLYNSGLGNTFDPSGTCPPAFRKSDMLILFE